MEREKLYRLLRLGIEKGASDIHFQVGYLPLYRFHGDLVELRYKVLTAKDTEADRFWGSEVGADLYLAKPADPAQVVQHVEQLLGAAR